MGGRTSIDRWEGGVSRRVVTAAVFTVSCVIPVAVAAPADAARCVSGAQVRGQVATFVHDLRDDVRSAEARTAVRGAMVQSVRAARGVEASTPRERRGLGEQISALARQLKDAGTLVERKAIVAEIHALQEQKRAGRVTGRDLRRLRGDIGRLEHALVAATDTRGEGRQVAAFVHELMAQFSC
jgi:hypothetical protein